MLTIKILLFLIVYLVQMYICIKIHQANKSRNPRSVLDFLYMTFLPILIFISFKHFKEKEK